MSCCHIIMAWARINVRTWTGLVVIGLLILYQGLSVLKAHHQIPQILVSDWMSGVADISSQSEESSVGLKMMLENVTISGEEQKPLVASVASQQLTIRSMTNINTTRPWQKAAPVIDTDIPIWMEAYVKFHNQSLHEAHLQTKDTDSHQYLIFSCVKSCSGTGNRQRAIMAAFMMAMVTNRTFLIDISHPVRLEQILEPHLIQWSWLPSHLNELSSKFIKARNVNPPVLDYPAKFQAISEQVIRIEANVPVDLERQWKAPAIRSYIQRFGVPWVRIVPKSLYKQIFWTLYRPTDALIRKVVALRQELGVNATTGYIAIHARTGGGGKWNDKDRFTTDKIEYLFSSARTMRKQFLERSNESFPIIVVSDDAIAKKTIYDMGPTVVRYANTKIIHVDRSRKKLNDLEGSLAVWADILVLAQATCIVKGRGSFSMLASWLSKSGCIQLLIA